MEAIRAAGKACGIVSEWFGMTGPWTWTSMGKLTSNHKETQTALGSALRLISDGKTTGTGAWALPSMHGAVSQDWGPYEVASV